MTELKSLTLMLAILLISGCAGEGGSSTQSEGKLKVIVTTYFLEDFTKFVGGDKVAVESLLPDGANPHVFEPSPSDGRKAHGASVFIYNGLGLEPYAEQLARSLPENVVVIEASKGTTLIESDDKD
ncbi:MAG: zinc ABC transporter substrate-binding protein, partial [Candidatus Micrarchaeota archaeon]